MVLQAGDRDLTLYFSEINGETCAGPWHFPPNLRVKTLQERLEDETFSSRCFDKHTEERLAFVRILTSCGVVLDESHCLIECPVRDGDTLTVVVVDCDDQEIRSESPGEVMVHHNVLKAKVLGAPGDMYESTHRDSKIRSCGTQAGTIV